MKRLVELVAAVLLPASLLAFNCETVRVETRPGRDGAVVSGVELIGEADGSRFQQWNSAQVADGWRAMSSGSVSTNVLVQNTSARVVGGIIATTTWDATMPVIVRNDVLVLFGMTLTIGLGAEVNFTADSRITLESSARLQCNGAEFVDFSESKNEIAAADVIVGESLVAIDFINLGAKVGRTRYYTAGARIGAFPELEAVEGADFEGWFAGGSKVSASTAITSGMREVVAKWKYHEMEVSPAASAASALGGEVRFTVAANTKWKVEPLDVDWISVAGSDEGEGNGELVLAVTANDSATERSAVVKIVAGGITRTVVVNQAAMAQLDEPVIVPPSGFVLTGPYIRVSITAPASMADAVVRFTTDGSEPTEESPLFEGYNARGTVTIKAKAFKSGYLASRTAVCSITRNVTLAEAINLPLWTVTTDADAAWTVVRDSEAFDGQSAARSAPLEDSPDYDEPVTSAMRTSVSGAGTLSFRWKVSCEKSDYEGEPYDYLALYVDGMMIKYIDGQTGWELVTCEIEGAGEHTVEWVYAKDYMDMGDVGEDCGWVDAAAWTAKRSADAAMLDMLDRIGVKVPAGSSAADALNADADGDGFTLAEELIAGTDPNDRDSRLLANINVGADGSPNVWPTPDLRGDGEREYILYGKRKLDDPDEEWTRIEFGGEGDYRFFKIECKE